MLQNLFLLERDIFANDQDLMCGVPTAKIVELLVFICVCILNFFLYILILVYCY